MSSRKEKGIGKEIFRRKGEMPGEEEGGIMAGGTPRVPTSAAGGCVVACFTRKAEVPVG